jgi:signal transduction histidine kinase
MSTRRVIPALRRVLLVPLVLGALAPILPISAEEYKHGITLYATRRDSQISIITDRYLPRLLHQGLGGDVDFDSEYLDLARSSDLGYQKVFAAFLRSKYRDVRFDIVVAMHDVAYDFAVANRGQLFGDAPIVFVAASPATRRVRNSTGLSLPYEFTRSLTLALTLQPSTRHVLVVSGADKRDREFERMARTQFQPFEEELDFIYLAGLSTTDLEARVANPPENSIIYYLVVNRDGAGDTYHPLEYLDNLSNVARAPIYSWVDSTMNHGIVGGSLKDQQAQADAVGRLALRVLRGESADDIPIFAPNVQVNQVDWRQLRQWNIDESRVPAGTRILFKDLSPWERYRPYVVLATILVMAQTALIAGLLIQGTRRRRAEEQLRKSQGELRHSYERTRDLGARLLHAQDMERARIARELHDDISQQLALLEIDLELLSETAPGTSEALARSTLNLSQNIAKSVHDLSHKLHPAKLRLIGLMAALKALQRDMSARSGISISLVQDTLPPLGPDITLCLFRVAQEALQNAAKHSRAREISVQLRNTGHGVTLTVADDGVGFDVEGAWKKGLGLISMAERLESIGGKLSVHSAPGEGTRLETTVPITEPSVLQTAG